TSWLSNIGASNHVTNELENLNIAAEYSGNNKLLMGKREAATISHFGNSFIQHPNHSKVYVLKNLLLVPKISRNLLSVSQFEKDNKVFFEFYPSFCFVKDQETQEVLLKGVLMDGLYHFNLQCLKNEQPQFLSS
ncbi:Unknown protein, partial [Striga hermonthica]